MFAAIFALLICVSFTEISSLPEDEGCIRIKDCPSALKHIPRVKIHHESLNILRNAHCGFNGLEPVVRCADIPNPPNDDPTNCIRLQDCPSALELIQTRVFDPQVVNMFRSIHCGMDKLQPLIHCNQINF